MPRITPRRPTAPRKTGGTPRAATAKAATAAKTTSSGWTPKATSDAAYRARGDQILREGKVKFTTTTPPLEQDVLKEIPLTPDPNDRNPSSLLVLTSGKFVLKYDPFDSPPYFTRPMK